VKQKMDTFAEINWSAVARGAFDEKIKDLEFIKKFKAKSAITEEFKEHSEGIQEKTIPNNTPNAGTNPH